MDTSISDIAVTPPPGVRIPVLQGYSVSGVFNGEDEIVARALGITPSRGNDISAGNIWRKMQYTGMVARPEGPIDSIMTISPAKKIDVIASPSIQDIITLLSTQSVVATTSIYGIVSSPAI